MITEREPTLRVAPSPIARPETPVALLPPKRKEKAKKVKPPWGSMKAKLKAKQNFASILKDKKEEMARPSMQNMDISKVLTSKAVEDKLPSSFDDQEDADMAKEIVKLQLFKERVTTMTMKVERA